MKKIVLPRAIAEELILHARAAEPEECCGLVGTVDGTSASTIYRAQNIAGNRRISYEAAPSDLFAAQRAMRARGEQLLAIYHSHPASPDPLPSETDVRLAYYPEAVYLIIGQGPDAIIGAFEIASPATGWKRALCDTL